MSTMLLPIKPEYVNNIFNGSKKYEYRKRLPRNRIDEIYIYSTYPKKKIVGRVEVKGVLAEKPENIWKKTHKYAGIAYEDYNKYFEFSDIAYAYILGEVNIFREALDLMDFGISTPPQSFMYFDDFIK